MPVQPKNFASKPFNPVSYCCVSHLSRYCHTKTCTLKSTRRKYSHKVLVLGFLAEFCQFKELWSFQNSVCLGKKKPQKVSSSATYCYLCIYYIMMSIKNVARYTDKRALPLDLRRLIILLPCLVDILFKNPCVRARFILLGWYVLFICKILNIMPSLGNCPKRTKVLSCRLNRLKLT